MLLSHWLWYTNMIKYCRSSFQRPFNSTPTSLFKMTVFLACSSKCEPRETAEAFVLCWVPQPMTIHLMFYRSGRLHLLQQPNKYNDAKSFASLSWSTRSVSTAKIYSFPTSEWNRSEIISIFWFTTKVRFGITKISTVIETSILNLPTPSEYFKCNWYFKNKRYWNGRNMEKLIKYSFGWENSLVQWVFVFFLSPSDEKINDG